MKGGAGKRKGSKFERQVCVALSKWASEDKQDDVFWRSAMSGGRATVANKKDKLLSNQVGDISCIDPVGKFFTDRFAVECKHLKDIGLDSAIKGNGPFIAIWKKLNAQAKAHKKEGFLVFRQNNWPVLLALDDTTEFKGYPVNYFVDPLVTYPRLHLNIYLFEEWMTLPVQWFKTAMKERNDAQ